MERGYLNATRAIGALTAVLGVALVATSLARGGGPLALGVVVGVAFTLLGSARVYMAGRARSRRRRT